MTPLYYLELCVLAVVCYFLYDRYVSRRRLPLPPGPKRRWFAGNLFDMPTSRPYLTYAKWGREYGPLTYVELPGQTIVIVNSYKAATDLLDTRGHIYSDRPRMVMAGELVGLNRSTALARFDVWKKHRKFLKLALDSRTVHREYAQLQERKTREYIKVVLEKPQLWYDGVNRMIGEALSELAYGDHRNDECDFVDLSDSISAMAAQMLAPRLVDKLPILKYVPDWMPGAGFKRDAKKFRQRYIDAEGYLFGTVKKQLQSGKPLKPSYVAKMLLDLEDRGGGEKGDEEVISASGFTFYRSGGGTTESSIKTFLLAMTLNPDIVAKAQAEIDQVIGDRLPTAADQPSLPYVMAIVLETLRWHSPSSEALPHRVIQEDEYMGYRIPRGTSVIVNLWGISRNEEYYPNPNKFDPERFYGKNKVDMQLDPRVFVFGFGRRVCPGLEVAWQGLWIAVATILWSFDIKGNPDLLANGRSMEELYKPTLISHPNPFPCEVRPRSEIVAQRISQGVA